MDLHEEFEFIGNEIKKIACHLKAGDISIASFVLGGLYARCNENCIKYKFEENQRTEK